MILKCSCRHNGQDTLHGTNNRVFNPIKGDPKTATEWRCTVCKSTQVAKPDTRKR